jgi:hypothetical protein
MKKIMLIAMVMLLALLVTAATYSSPGGFVKLRLVNGYAMIAIPLLVEDMALNDFNPATTCVGEMLAENLTGTTSALTAPAIYWYTGDGFESAFLFGGIWGHPLDRQWIGPAGPSLKVLDCKTGYYFKNNAIVEAVILGEDNVDDTTDIVLVAGYNLIAYPYLATLTLNGGNFISAADGATNSTSAITADNVYRYTGAGFESAFLFGGIPGHPLDDMWIGPAGPSTMSIDPGVGFYYLAQNPFTWTITRPFPVD